MILNKKLTIRIIKKLITLWTLGPIYRDKLFTRISRKLSDAGSTPARKIALGAPFILLGGGLAISGIIIWSIIAFIPAVLIFGQPVKIRLAQRILVRRLSGYKPDSVLSTFSARTDLLKLGVEPEAVDEILSRHKEEKEVLIAEIDQQNRMLSHIESGLSSASSSVDQENFEKRRHHKIELVVMSGILAIKKTYCNYGYFSNELLALNALGSLPIVPKLVAVSRNDLVIYQTFLRGQNLGSILDEHGITIDDQFHFTYPGIGNWSEDAGESRQRSRIMTCLQGIMSSSQIECISNLLTTIHRTGIAVKDVKYGNIIIGENEIYMCDFDGAEVFQSNSRGFVRARELDRDKFNYYFGAGLQTTTVLRANIDIMAQKRDNLLYSPVYYGNGYGVGGIGSIELGSGKWLFIRRVLPDLRGKTVLDLGCNNGMLPLEMLRAGARKVTAYELDPTYATFARLSHQWFEMVDNQTYDFELVQGYMREACDRDLSPYDVATSFCSLYYEEPEEMERIVATLSKAVKVFVVQCNENPEEKTATLLERSSRPYLQALLADNGFPNQQVFAPRYYTRPLIIARTK